ncbi:MAG: transporter substrate-binding protein [Rhodospirillales bacterium]|nr:transporter substrate-binding protein [Rhodospirillales bacterium]
MRLGGFWSIGAVVSSLAAGAAGLGFTASAAAAATPHDTVVMAKQIDDIISLDPAESFEVSGQEVIGNLYDRLLAHDPGDAGQVKGELAQSWSVDDDGLTYRFRLKPGLHFASGNPVTAEDAAFSLQRAVLLDRSPAFILGQFGLTKDNVRERVQAVAADTLVLRTEHPLSPSLVYLCLTAAVGSIVDATLVRGHARDDDLGNDWLKRNSAGSGPFTLRLWRANERYTLEANDGYWGDKPSMRRIIVRHIPEPAMQRLLLEKGDIDYARNLTRDQVAALADQPGIVAQSGPKGGILYLALNTENRALGKPQVQQALKYLVDYDGIAAHIAAPNFKVHQSFLPEGFLGAVTAQPFAFDLQKARVLMAAAKLAKGFTVTLDVQGSSPWIDIAQALQAKFALVGIDMRIAPADLKQILTKYRARRHEMALLTWEPDYPDPNTNAQAFASNPDNSPDAAMKTLAWRNGWDIPELSRRTEEAALERDASARAELYRGLQAEVQESSPYVVMFQQVEVAVHRSNVDGLFIAPAGDVDLYAKIVKH